MPITRINIAFALSPIFPTLYFLALPYFYGTTYTGGFDVFFIILLSLPVSYAVCLLLDIPMYFFLLNKKLLNIVNVVTIGAIAGAIVFYIWGFGFAALLGSSKNVIPSLSELFWGAALGVMVALPFGLIAGLPFFDVKNVE